MAMGEVGVGRRKSAATDQRVVLKRQSRMEYEQGYRIVTSTSSSDPSEDDGDNGGDAFA